MCFCEKEGATAFSLLLPALAVADAAVAVAA